MSYVILQYGGKPSYMTYSYLVESAEDLASIPSDKVTFGSTAQMVSSNGVTNYIRNSLNQWILVSNSGGGGGGGGDQPTNPHEDKTHIYIVLSNSRALSPTLYLEKLGTNIKITWGDGNTNTYTTQFVNANHTYNSNGSYHIIIEGNCKLGQLNVLTSKYSGLFGYGDLNVGQNTIAKYYASCVTYCYLGTNVVGLNRSALHYCINAKKIEMENTVTSIGRQGLASCFNITSLSIPSSVTTTNYYLANNCVNLESVVFDNFTAFSSYSLSACTKLKFINFKNYTSVPALPDGTILYDVLTSKVKITVPPALLNAWKTATNWVLYADIIQAAVS